MSLFPNDFSCITSLGTASGSNPDQILQTGWGSGMLLFLNNFSFPVSLGMASGSSHDQIPIKS